MYNLWNAHLEIYDTFKDQKYNSTCYKIALVLACILGDL